MRVPWFQCPTAVRPVRAVLPRREPGTHLPDWLRRPTRPAAPRWAVGWLTPGQQWRADGGRC